MTNTLKWLQKLPKHAQLAGRTPQTPNTCVLRRLGLHQPPSFVRSSNGRAPAEAPFSSCFLGLFKFCRSQSSYSNSETFALCADGPRQYLQYLLMAQQGAAAAAAAATAPAAPTVPAAAPAAPASVDASAALQQWPGGGLAHPTPGFGHLAL